MVLFALYAFIPDFLIINTSRPIRLFATILVVIGLVVIAVSALQLNRNLSPFPSPKKNGKLITNGLYSIIRHPIYLGLIIFFFGYGLHSGSLSKLLITIMLSILFHYKANYEEKLLVNVFSDYKTYQLTTFRIFPFI